MHVQIKGKQSNDLSINEISYPVEVIDLKNYLLDGGAIYFVVYISKDGCSKKIFYNALTPVKLKNYCTKSESKKTKHIKFKVFPEDNIEKVDIFINFFNDSKKQISFINVKKLSTLEELKEQGILEEVFSTVTTCNTKNPNPFKAFLSNEVYLYAKIKGSAIPQPLDLNPAKLSISTKENLTVSINGVPFYNSIERIFTKDSTLLKIGESTTIAVPQSQSCMKINYQSSDKLRAFSKDLEFMLALLDSGRFELNKTVIELDTESLEMSKFDISKQTEMLVQYKQIVLLLDTLGARKEIEISKLSRQDWKNLYMLVRALIDHEPINGLKLRSAIHFSKVKVASFMFALLLEQYNETKGSYLVSDFFTNQGKCYTAEHEGRKFETTKFVMLKAEDFLETTNLKLDLILPAFQNIPTNSENVNHANNTLLNMLLAYDSSNNRRPDLLKSANDFAEWLMNVDDNLLSYDIRCLNRLQVIRRQRDFTEKEIEGLCSIIENRFNSNEEALIGAYLLLDNQVAAKVHFEKLDIEKQKSFKEYPIYRFWKQDQ